MIKTYIHIPSNNFEISGLVIKGKDGAIMLEEKISKILASEGKEAYLPNTYLNQDLSLLSSENLINKDLKRAINKEKMKSCKEIWVCFFELQYFLDEETMDIIKEALDLGLELYFIPFEYLTQLIKWSS